MKRALLVIDVQNEYLSGALPISHPAGSLENILRAMDAAAAAGLPVVVIRHTSMQEGSPVFVEGSPSWELHPQVAKRPRDLLLEKNLPGAFSRTGLEKRLREREVDTVTICGYMTQMCCDSTARQAFHRGFGVEFLADATGTLDLSNEAGSVTAEELHRAVLVTQATVFSRILSTEAWSAELS
ncbi:MAG: cysteine hydrolase family protein [Desulfarculaceae bacterium]|jgi:nicotinamidase-related amidase